MIGMLFFTTFYNPDYPHFIRSHGKLGPHNLRRAHIDARQRDYIGGQKRAQHASRRSRNCPSVVR